MAPTPEEQWPLDWIDGYAARIRPFVHVREEDRLLIKVPNEAYKLNPSGVRVLRRVLEGTSAAELLREQGGAPEVRRDLYEFFTGLWHVLQGRLPEDRAVPGVDRKPFTLGFNTLPVLSEVALTHRCNLACRFCYAGCGGAPAVADAMDTAAVKRVLDIIRNDAQTPSVSFTGGEPTLRADLCELIAHAREVLGMRVNLITNGTRVDREYAARLAAAGLHSAQVSLEAPEAGAHDAVTRRPGSFALTLRGLECLQKADIRVHTNTTLNRINIEHGPAMPAFVKSLGMERFSMNLVIPAGTGRAEAAEVAVTYRDAAPWLPRIQAEAARADVEFMWYSPTPVCIFNPIQHRLGNKGCAACDGLLSVSPEGDVLPCSSWPEPVGNLLREPFRAVWDSARACHLRAKGAAPEGCAECGDFALCQGACPLYWDYFGCAELEETRHAAAGR